MGDEGADGIGVTSPSVERWSSLRLGMVGILHIGAERAAGVASLSTERGG